MSTSTVSTVIAPKTAKTSKVKALTPLQEKNNLLKQMEELRAAIAKNKALELELASKEKEVNAAATAELENEINAFAKKVGKDLATLSRCFMSMAKNEGHLKGETSSVIGERKERVVLNDTAKAAVITELRAMQSAKDAIISHCKEIASRPGMPGFQTIYNWATEANIQGKPVASK